MKFIITLFLVFCFFGCVGQKAKTKKGLMVLEDDFVLFFIPSKYKNLYSFLSHGKDSVSAYLIYKVGNTSYPQNLKDKLAFDSLKAITSKLSSDQRSYDDSSILYWEYGKIKFKDQKFPLLNTPKNIVYKKRKFNLNIFNYLLIEEFKSDRKKQKKHIG